MKNLKIIELYNLSSDKLMMITFDNNLINFIVKNEKNIIEMNEINRVNKNNKTYIDILTKHKFDFPEFVNSFVGDQKYNCITREIIDKKNKVSKGIIKSKLFDLLKLEINFEYKYEDLGFNFCQKTINLTFNSKISVLGNKLENFLINKFKENIKFRENIVKIYLENNKNIFNK